MKKLVYDPKDLIPVSDLCEDGTFPFHPRSVERMCRDGDIPAVKVGNVWRTTREAARTYFWKHANKAFKEVSI